MASPGLRQLRWLADFLDTRYRLPGGFRIGWDGLLGLVPLIGDLITASMSLYILAQAASLGCPPSVLLRMGLNILIDNLFDSVPIFGQLFDFVWKSNRMNMVLLEKHLADPKGARRSSRLVVAGILLLIIFAVMALVYLGLRITWWLFFS